MKVTKVEDLQLEMMERVVSLEVLLDNEIIPMVVLMKSPNQ